MTGSGDRDDRSERDRLLFEHAPVGIAVYSEDGIEMVNPAAARILGYDAPDELLGLSLAQIVHPDGLARVIERLQRLRAGEEGLYPVKERYLRKDGTVAEVEVTAVPITFRGRPAVQGIVTDISERTRVAHELAASERRYRALFENMNAGFALFEVVEDDEGRAVDLVFRAGNAGVSAVTGKAIEDVLDRRLTEVLPGIENDAVDWIGTFATVARSGAPARFEEPSDLLGRNYAVSAFRSEPGFCAVTFIDETERHQANAAMRAQEAKFRHVFEAANVAKSITLTSGEVHVNEAFARMVGYSREELDGMSRHDFYHPDEAAVIEARVAAMLTGEEDAARFETKLVRKDGELVWVDLSTRLVREDGRPAYFITTAVDISERKHAEAELRAAEKRFSDAFDASPAGMTLSRISDGLFIEVNRAFLEMFELEREQVIGSNAVALGMLTQAERDAIAARKREVGGIEYDSLQARAGSGRVVDIVFSSRPLTVAGEACFISTMIDVTEHRLLEAAFVASQERYDRLTRNLPDMVWVIDPKGRLQFVNAAVSKILGYDPAELLGRPLNDFLAHTSIERMAELCTRFDGGQDGRFAIVAELDYLDREGRVVQCELHAAATLDAQGEIVAIEGVTRDMRERQAQQAQQQEIRRQLELAQKLESVARLAGGIAHDFNNILMVILSYAAFAVEALDPDDPIRGDVSEIHMAGERAAALTKQLLAFSRKQVLTPEVLDINDVVADIERMLRRLLGEDVDVRVHGTPVSKVLADRGQLEQVLMNLAVNARDAMPHGGTLTIETAEAKRPDLFSDDDGRCVMLTLRDTGGGMDEEVCLRIFEPFFTTKERGKGTGLGLSTVHGIVKQSGGHVEVHSELGQGTTFAVFLPPAADDAVAAVRGERPSDEVKPRGRETVLVVEDDEAVRRLAERMLRNAGYVVLTAANGEEAIHIGERADERIDLVVTDVVMPHMSGPELADRLGELRPEIEVLYVSGYTDDAVLRHGVVDPRVNVLAKPFSAADLARKVRQVLDER